MKDTEEFLNLCYHDTLGICPYQLIHMRPPPREISELITFPEQPPEEINLQKVLNRVHHQAYMRRKKQENKGIPNLIYKNGEKILIKNRQQPSSTEGIAKKLLLLCVGPFVIKKAG